MGVYVDSSEGLGFWILRPRRDGEYALLSGSLGSDLRGLAFRVEDRGALGGSKP